MRKFLKFGCLGIVGLVVVFGVLGAIAGGSKPAPQQQVSGQPAPAAGKPAAQQIGQVGQTVSLGGWEVTLSDFGPYDRFSGGKAPATKPQGKLLVADMRIKNLQNTTSNFTDSDFALSPGDGRTFKPASVIIDKGFIISQTVQPGLVTENRVVFDADPAATAFTFTALKMVFSVSAP